MNKNTLSAFVAAGLLVVFTASAMALERVNLKLDAFRNAKGDVTIVQAGSPEQRRLDINLSGLQPNGVYTAWFGEIGTDKQAPVGKKGASFKSDNNGNARFSAIVSEREVESWDKIQIVYHPDGDPQNMDLALFSLSGDLPQDV